MDELTIEVFRADEDVDDEEVEDGEVDVDVVVGAIEVELLLVDVDDVEDDAAASCALASASETFWYGFENVEMQRLILLEVEGMHVSHSARQHQASLRQSIMNSRDDSVMLTGSKRIA